MPNNLTGAYEAVVQVAVRQINGLLASLHQNGASDDAPLKLLHSAVVRVGDPHTPPGPFGGVVGDFADWVRSYQRARGPVGLGDLNTHLTGTAPPGAAKMLADFFSKLGEIVVTEPPPGTVRGTVKVQLASAWLSLPSGSTSEITAHVNIRAHYYPDADTDPMPEPVHGEVQATFEVRQQTIPHSGRRLLVQPSSQDSKIQFVTAPGTGLSAADVARISAQVRKAVRESFTMLPVDLPSDFAFSDFKGLGSGPGQAVALPIQLSGASLPPGGIQSVNNLFVGPAGFAFAVSKEYVLSVFQPTINNLLQFTQDFTVSINIYVGTLHPHYHFSVTSVDLQFTDGSISLVVKGKATSPSWYAPNYNNIVITQRVTLVMFLDTLFIPAPDDELTISGVPDSARNTVKLSVIAARNQALPPAQNALNQELHKAKARLSDSLGSFDPSASASFRAGHSEEPGASASGAIAITQDGVIVRGDIVGSPRSAPVVSIAETDHGQSFTALESWIPGGGITRLTWSWVEFSGPSIFHGVQKSVTDEHRFILPKPGGITQLSSICLRIEGFQTMADGHVLSPVAGGTTCQVPDFGGVLEVPSWWEPVTVPIWQPDLTADTVLKDAVAGHITVQADAPQKNGLTHNSLVHFADWKAEKPLAALAQALAQTRRKGFSLVVFVVLPAVALDSHRRDVEAKLDLLREGFPAQLLLTADHEGGWTRTFAVSKTPSTYLINAKREFVWKYEGAVDPKVLAAALDEHLVPAPAPRSRPLRLAVAPGDRAPDVFFKDDRGQGFAVHRFRGREALLNFWQSWSEPCIKELLRLQQLQKGAGGPGPIIVAFHGGKDPKILEEIRKQHGLSFSLVHDADQVIARRYGVRCWPTTVSVNAAGLVSHVQFGVSHDHAPASGRTEAGS
jgi:peroxiredoxin